MTQNVGRMIVFLVHFGDSSLAHRQILLLCFDGSLILILLRVIVVEVELVDVDLRDAIIIPLVVAHDRQMVVRRVSDLIHQTPVEVSALFVLEHIDVVQHDPYSDSDLLVLAKVNLTRSARSNQLL